MVKNKLLLINPKNQQFYHGYRALPPIALAIVKALTPKHWQVDVVDENFQSLPNAHYNMVGITTNTLNISKAYELAAMYRAKNSCVVLGGAHVTSMPDEAVQFADAVVVGDAENVWTELIADFESNRLQKKYYSADNPRFLMPDISFYGHNYTMYGIETSRGCHNHCAFCGIHMPRHKNYVRKPLDMIIEELQQSKNPFFTFVDNNFYGNDDAFLMQLFEEMLKQKINKKWQTGVSVNFFNNKELVKMAAKAGAAMFFVGFESDTGQSLKELNKNNFRQSNNILGDYRSIIKTCHKNGIMVSGNFMLGIEGDTEQIIAERAAFFKKLELDECACVLLTPLPATRIFQKYHQENRLFYTNFPDDWKHYHYGKSLVKHENISPQLLEQLAYEYNMQFRQRFSDMAAAFITTGSLKSTVFYYLYCRSFGKYSSGFFDRLASSMQK